MRIVELTAYHVRLQLRRPVRHALAERRWTDNLVVCCRLADGTEGWGEGLPRPYVTGETIEGAFEQLAETDFRPLTADADDYAQVVDMLREWRPKIVSDDPRGMYGNAVRCAVELSVLDAFGRHFAEPLARVIELWPPAEPIRAHHDHVRYSGAITAEGSWKERLSAWKIRLYGFHQCKVKVAVEGADDVARLRRIRRILGSGVDIRVDANGGWPASEAADRIMALQPFGITAVEQPVSHEEIGALAEIRNRVSAPIMLDESLCSLSDAQRAIDHGLCDLFNLRISKCGGLIPTLDLAVLAHQHGLGYQLGCQVGESGILSAAGRHFAAAVDGIRYLEGSYDRHLVRDRLTQQDLTFGYGGWAPALGGPGLGVEIDRDSLHRLCLREQRWPIG